MLRTILTYGTIAGLIVAVPMLATPLIVKHELPAPWGHVIGYTTMLVALSAVFVAIKRRRDGDLGGVIRFWPALGLGLAISVVAGIFYVAAWDAFLAITHMDFAGGYGRMQIEQAKAHGASAAALAKLAADMQAFQVQYANPLYRWPETFAEIFPVGVIVSLISAALLRNPRFLPARR